MLSAESITVIVQIFAGVGIIAFFYSLISLWHDQKCLRDLKEAYNQKDDEPSSKLLNRGDLEEWLYGVDDRRESLIGRRIQNVLYALARNKENLDSQGTADSEKTERKSIAAPQVQDLHRMTSQLVYTRTMPTVLRVITSILLIIGICGTLIGVHGVLDTGYAVDITRMPEALEPSKWAVASTIVLVICRGFFNAWVDRHIWEIDRLTMMHLLPDLMPASELSQVLGPFSTAVRELGKSLKKLNGKAKDMTSVSEKMEESVNIFETASKEFNEFVTEQSKKVQAKEASEQKSREVALQMLVTMKKQMSELNDNLSTVSTQAASAKDYADRFSEKVESLNGLTDKLSGFGTSMKELEAKLSGAMSTLAQDQQDRESLQKTLDSLSSRTDELSIQLATIGTDSELLKKHAETISSAAGKCASVSGKVDEVVTKVGSIQQEVEGSVKGAVLLKQKIDQADRAASSRIDAVTEQLDKVEKELENKVQSISKS